MPAIIIISPFFREVGSMVPYIYPEVLLPMQQPNQLVMLLLLLLSLHACPVATSPDAIVLYVHSASVDEKKFLRNTHTYQGSTWVGWVPKN